MANILILNRFIVPASHIAWVEASDPSDQGDIKAPLFLSRVVALDRVVHLSEEDPAALTARLGFAHLVLDHAAFNPHLLYELEPFQASDKFRPAKNFLTRLVWRDATGKKQQKLLLTDMNSVLEAFSSDEIEDNASRPIRLITSKRLRQIQSASS